MSEAVELVRRRFEYFFAGEIDAWIKTIDPEIEWDISAYPLPDWPDRGRGREALKQNLLAYLSGWNDYSAEVRELTDLGGEVLLVLRERARMRGSDVPIDRDLHQVWTVPGERATRLRVFKTREAAIEAASRDSI